MLITLIFWHTIGSSTNFCWFWTGVLVPEMRPLWFSGYYPMRPILCIFWALTCQKVVYPQNYAQCINTLNNWNHITIFDIPWLCMTKFCVKSLILDPPLSTKGWIPYLEVIKICYLELTNYETRGTLSITLIILHYEMKMLYILHNWGERYNIWA